MTDSYIRIPKSEIEFRISRLKSQLKQANADGALIFSIVELYYYTGIGLNGAIYVPVEGEPIHLVKRNLSFAKSYSQIETVQLFGRRSKIFETLEIKNSSRVAIEKDILSASFEKFLKLKGNSLDLIDGSSIFRQIRSNKSELEINLIEQAANLIDQSFEYCANIATPEMTEIELASRLDSWLLERGHSGYITTRAFNSALLFYSYVISSGSSTLNIHFTPISGGGLSLKYPFGPSNKKLKRNLPFFVDSCGNHQGYISDTTRTFICGHFDKETLDYIEALRQVKRYISEKLKPKINLGELFQDVMELSKELGIYDNFMGTKSDKSAFLGHGIGLELDELPIFYRKGTNLETGNTLACEPKFIIQGSMVLGIEDDYAITDSGNRLLSKSRDYFEI